MRLFILILLASCCFAEDVKPGMPVSSTPAILHKGDPGFPADAPTSAKPTVTADDLQNLAICARQVLPSLTPEQMSAIAVAIKHAEDDAKVMRATEPKKP